MSKKISFFVISFLLLYRVHSAISLELTPTLDNVKKSSSNYQVDTPFSLQTAQSVGDSSVVSDGTTYYFNPENDNIARILASTPARNLVLTSQNDAVFEVEGNYYKFDTEQLPEPVYRILDGTSADYNFSVKNVDEGGELSDEYYKISFEGEDNKVLFGKSENVSWTKVSSAGANTIEIRLPSNGQEGTAVQDIRYYKYDYTPIAGRTTITTRQTALAGNVDADFLGVLSTTNGGVIYNNSGTIGNITGDFIGNHILQTTYSYGGAIYNRGKIESVVGNFINNYIEINDSNAYGGGVANSGGTITNITGDFINNYLKGNLAYGGALYNANNSKIEHMNSSFIGNYAQGGVSSYAQAYGGAIYNDNSTLGKVTGDFIGNYAFVNTGEYRQAYGGAVYVNDSNVESFVGDFVGNYASGPQAYGGGVYARGSEIENIIGNFIRNYVSGPQAYGGAIYFSGSNMKLTNLIGDFIGNYASSTSYARGGAIYNIGVIDNIKGSFIDNYATSSSYSAYGGAIHNYNSTISVLSGKFIRNYASGQEALGGAIYNNNTSTIKNIDGEFIANYVHSTTDNAYGGAIYNQKSIDHINATFVGNFAKSNNYMAQGGAISNVRDYNTEVIIGNISGSFINNYAENVSTANNNLLGGGAIYNGSIINTITGSFDGNYAKSVSSNISGGAIYNGGTVAKIDNITATFTKNYVISTSSDIYGGAISNNNGTITTINSDFLENYISSTKTVRGGAIYNHDSSTISNIEGAFKKNYSSGEYAYGGAISNFEKIGKIKGNFVENYVTANTNAVGGAIHNYKQIDEIAADFVGNYVTSTIYSSYGGAIHNMNRGNIDNITGDFIGNYASSQGSYAYGGAIHNAYGTVGVTTTSEKRDILFENNKTISFAGKNNELKKLNSINFTSAGSIFNFNTIADSYINIKDPMTSLDGATVQNGGTLNKTGAGSFYLWGDNSELGSTINIQEGDFAALFAEAEDLINDPLGQRQTFNLSNATINFADNTTFRPMVTANKIAELGNTPTVGDNVNLRPYNISSLNVGSYTYAVDYSQFKGMENELIKIDTTGTDLKVDLKKDLAGYEGLGAAVDAYRKLPTLSVADRAIFDNIYYTGEVSQEIKDKFFEEIDVISGEDIIIYNQVHKASIRQFSRQIYSRIQNKNCPSCGMAEGYSDQHLWVNVGKNYINQDTKGNTLGYKYDPTSIAIGYDHDIIPSALNMGVAFGYAYGDVKGKASSIYNTAEINEYMLSLYWKYKPLRAYVTGSLGGGYMNNKTKLVGSSIDATGKSETRAAFANVEFGYDFGNSCGVLEPFVGFEYAYIYNKAYTEKGFGARHFNSSDYNSIELPIGFRVSRNIAVESYIVTPSIELAYSRSLGDRNSEVESHFVSSPNSPWVMRGASDSRDSLRSGLNLKINNIDNPFAFNFGYARDTRSDYSDDQLYLTVRYNF